MTIDTKSLRALALAATPGPWHRARWADDAIESDHGKTVIAGGSIGYENAWLNISDDDAAYVIAANPSAGLALLDEIDTLRALLAEACEIGMALADTSRHEESIRVSRLAAIKRGGGV